MTTRYIVLRPFKQGDRLLERGEEFIPDGGKWDHILIDPEKKYVRIEEVPDAPKKPVQKKVVKKKKAKPKAKKKAVKQKKYGCDYCERVFDTPQGKAAHTRFCKEKNE